MESLIDSLMAAQNLLEIPEESMLRTPSAIEGDGGAISENQARERGRMVQVRDQMAQLAFENGLKVAPGIAESLLPTPNTMEHREIKTPEQIEALREKSPGGYRNLREVVVNELPDQVDNLLPTVLANGPMRNSRRAMVTHPTKRSGVGLNQAIEIAQGILPREFESWDEVPASLISDESDDMVLLRTPMASEGSKAPAQQDSETKGKTGQVWLSNQAKDISNENMQLLGTPRATASESSAVQVDQGAPKARLEDQVLTINWGKFEPAIRRWEYILGRPAPAPTKPDGKDGAHRLSSSFTEWMQGLPEGWICGHGLSRVQELKMAGNGVCPQQATYALTLLLNTIERN